MSEEAAKDGSTFASSSWLIDPARTFLRRRLSPSCHLKGNEIRPTRKRLEGPPNPIKSVASHAGDRFHRWFFQRNREVPEWCRWANEAATECRPDRRSERAHHHNHPCWWSNRDGCPTVDDCILVCRPSDRRTLTFLSSVVAAGWGRRRRGFFPPFLLFFFFTRRRAKRWRGVGRFQPRAGRTEGRVLCSPSYLMAATGRGGDLTAKSHFYRTRSRQLQTGNMAALLCIRAADCLATSLTCSSPNRCSCVCVCVGLRLYGSLLKNNHSERIIITTAIRAAIGIIGRLIALFLAPWLDSRYDMACATATNWSRGTKTRPQSVLYSTWRALIYRKENSLHDNPNNDGQNQLNRGHIPSQWHGQKPENFSRLGSHEIVRIDRVHPISLL